MKKRIAAALFTILILAVATAAIAGGADQTEFYNQMIDQRIAKCEMKSSLSERQLSPAMQECAEFSKEQAEFLRSQKQILVREMIDHKVPLKAHAVDHYLIKAFTTHTTCIAVAEK